MSIPIMGRLCLLAALLVCYVHPLCAVAQGRASAYDFLDITGSSHIYGLGGINVSTVTDDINTVDQNPALLGPEFDMQLGLNYMNYIGGSNFAGVMFGTRASDRSAWGVAVRYFGYGSMQETDASGSVIGDFSPKDLKVGGLYSHDITDRLRGGIAINAIMSHYAGYSAFALGTDLGLNYFDPERDLSLSVVAANLGGQIKRFNDTYERLPIDVRVGWTQSFDDFPVRFSVTAWNLTKWHLPFYETTDGSAGSEMQIKDSFGTNLFRHLIFGADLVTSQSFNLSLGYNYSTRCDMSTYSRNLLSGFSLGAGLKVKSLSFGVALARPHIGATTVMVNFSTTLYEFQ